MVARFPRVILTVPFVPQRNHGECLVACAAMALAHLGRQVDYQSLARAIDLTQIGTPFPNIRRLASSDLHVHVRHGDLQVLYDHLQRGRPCIASVQADHLPHWRGEDFAHAVVVVGMDEDFVIYMILLSPSIRCALGWVISTLPGWSAMRNSLCSHLHKWLTELCSAINA